MYCLLRCKKANIENIKFGSCCHQLLYNHSTTYNGHCSRSLHSPAYNIQGDKSFCRHLNEPYKPLHLKKLMLDAKTSITKTVRFQSTTSVTSGPLEKVIKKRLRRPRFAKYVELLEVTKSAANERKNRVKRLKAKNLQEFICKSSQGVKENAQNKQSNTSLVINDTTNAQQSLEYQNPEYNFVKNYMMNDVNADNKPYIYFKEKCNNYESIFKNPENINNILKSFQDYKDHIESITLPEQIEKNNFSHNLEDEENVDIYETPGIVPRTSPNICKKNVEPQNKPTLKIIKNEVSAYKSKTYQSEEFALLSKQRALKDNLNAYLDVCVSTGLLNRGLSTLLTYRERGRKHQHVKNCITIDLYNVLLHGFASKGLLERVHYILNLIKQDDLNFNEQTFSAIFECLGRLKSTKDNNLEIQKYIRKAESMGFTLHDIMNKSQFKADQRNIVTNAILRIYPNFKPTYILPNLNYNNVLLNHLNNSDTEIQQNNECATLEKSFAKNADKMWDSKSGYTKDKLQKFFQEQLEIESKGYITVQSIVKSKTYTNMDFYRAKLEDSEKMWRSQIIVALGREMNGLRAHMQYKPQGYMNYYTYLKSLNMSHYVDILIKEIYKLAEGSETYSPTVGQLYRELGQKVQFRYQNEMKTKNGMLEKIKQTYGSYCEVWDNCNQNNNVRQIWQLLIHQQRSIGPSVDIVDTTWPPNVLSGVGRFLYNILMKDIKIDANIMRQNYKNKQNLLPAFYTLFRNHGRLVKEEVKPHPILSRLFRASRQQNLVFDSYMVPMLCPPLPWSSPYNGGYLINKTDLIRLPNQAIQQWERIKATPIQNLYPTLDSLNQLSSIPWRVNTDILDILIKIFQDGGDKKLDVPQSPSSLSPLPSSPVQNTSTTSTERIKLLKEKMLRRRKEAEMYSLWCDTLYRLSLANHYRNKVFWLPHNMDFRGRVYPVPPHLNHLGSDLARSILIFDQPRPLGNDGFKWLKLHCVNLTGLKKRNSLQERLNYAEDVMPEILDSADNPLTGHMWWRNAEEPWQTLACCMEIAKVYRSSNPAEYLSHFPVHQDGSCNGLQHYAALGRDQAGAVSVNLAPSVAPHDVYSSVAALVEKARKIDATSGLAVAKALEGFVQRKVIKQTVMTTVYGVTRFGARLQIARQLKDIDEFPQDWVWPASTYLTTKTFESIREMFTSTREIQDWFTECARMISSVRGKNVEWITPLGLPVVQPYNRQEYKYNVKSNIHAPEVMSSDLFEKPNVMKQKNAFPPNFIHSLDSSHMMLTSIHCERQGLTFVSVHDCFWTHPCSVSSLNRICREQFVGLHSQPILEELSKFLKNMYGFSDFASNDSSEDFVKARVNRVLKKLPKTGDFNLNEVLQSEYFFS